MSTTQRGPSSDADIVSATATSAPHTPAPSAPPTQTETHVTKAAAVKAKEKAKKVARVTVHRASAAHFNAPRRGVATFTCLQRFHFGPLISAAVVEGIGTFYLVLTVALTSIFNAELAPIHIGLMLMALVFSFGYLSGGHVNPMVTIAVWLCTASPSQAEREEGDEHYHHHTNNNESSYGSSEDGGEGGGASENVGFSKRRAVLYIVAQLIGGALATLVCMLIHGREFPVPNMGLNFIQMLRGFLAESLFTFVLCSVVLHVAISKQRNNSFYGFAIGFAVLCGGLTCGPISGGAFNPAVATPLIVLRCMFSFDSDGCTPMASLWVYWASEVVGAVAASMLYLALQNIKEDVAAEMRQALAEEGEDDEMELNSMS